MSFFQKDVERWMLSTFGEGITHDKTERNQRFLEEALELVQAAGCTKDEALQAVEYVFDRPQGAIGQEVGGVLVTLAAFCFAHGRDMMCDGYVEMARCWSRKDEIRAKQAAKPRFDESTDGVR